MFIVFLAFGDMVIALWNKVSGKRLSYSLIDKIWAGLCCLGVILLYLSLFLPIDIKILIIIGIISLAYLVWKNKTIKVEIGNIIASIAQYPVWGKALLALSALAVLLYAVCTPLIYDVGLYHLQTMQWIDSFKTVIGLGNLHGRFGFNSSSLLLSTLFNYHPDHYSVFFSLNSFALCIFSVWLIKTTIEHKNVLYKGVLLGILLVSLFSIGANVSSTSTDILSNILIIYLLLRLTLNKQFVQQGALITILIPAFCLTLKLSSAAIILVSLFSLIWMIKNGERKIALFCVLIGLVIAIPWLTRFIMLTGYLIYPFPFLDFLNVDWKIPVDMVIAEKNATYAWGRLPDMPTDYVMGLKFSQWFPLWLERISNYNLVLYLSALIAPFVLLFSQKDSRILIWIIAFAGLLLGFFTAPDFRFLFGFLVPAITIPLFIFFSDKEIDLKSRNIYALCILPLIGIVYIASSQVLTYQNRSKNTAISLLYKPQSIELGRKQNITFKEYQINNTTIFIPQETNQCFDQSIPCAPYYDSNLEMRGETIEDGFRIKTK